MWCACKREGKAVLEVIIEMSCRVVLASISNAGVPMMEDGSGVFIAHRNWTILIR